MRRLNVFLHVLKHSLFPFDAYYTKVKRVHLGFSMKYFWLWIALGVTGAVLIKAFIFVATFPPTKLRAAVKQVEASFPNELVIHMNSIGRLSTNIDQPYIVFAPLEHNPRPLLVIDPKSQKSALMQYGTEVLMTERRAYIRNQGIIYDYKYPVGQPMRIDKSTIEGASHAIQMILHSYWAFILLATFVGITFGIPFLGLSYLLTLLCASLVFYILLQLFFKNRKMSYKAIFTIGLHAATGPILIQVLAFIFGLNPTLPMWYTAILYVFFAGALYEAYFEKV